MQSNKSKFTKGEWEAKLSFSGKYGDGTISSGGFDIAIVCGTNYSDSPIGGVNRDWRDGYEAQDVEEHEANAHLIAAAPDHDRALCMIEDKMTVTPNVFGGKYSITLNQEEVDQIRKSLSKARGGL
jgi:hypothetical protein